MESDKILQFHDKAAVEDSTHGGCMEMKQSSPPAGLHLYCSVVFHTKRVRVGVGVEDEHQEHRHATKVLNLYKNTLQHPCSLKKNTVWLVKLHGN